MEIYRQLGTLLLLHPFVVGRLPIHDWMRLSAKGRGVRNLGEPTDLLGVVYFLIA